MKSATSCIFRTIRVDETRQPEYAAGGGRITSSEDDSASPCSRWHSTYRRKNSVAHPSSCCRSTAATRPRRSGCSAPVFQSNSRSTLLLKPTHKGSRMPGAGLAIPPIDELQNRVAVLAGASFRALRIAAALVSIPGRGNCRRYVGRVDNIAEPAIVRRK